MTRGAVIGGRVTADTVNNSVALVIIVIVGVIVGFRPANIPGLIFGLVLLLAFAFSTCFIFALVGLHASNVQAVNAATFPVIFPLTFASSAFVPTSTMPTWLQAFANHQPVTILINAVRSLTLGPISQAQRDDLFNGASTTSLVIQTLLWTVAILVVFSYLCIRRFNSPNL
jgi:ABC-type multidrug transport system permease subunit